MKSVLKYILTTFIFLCAGLTSAFAAELNTSIIDDQNMNINGTSYSINTTLYVVYEIDPAVGAGDGSWSKLYIKEDGVNIIQHTMTSSSGQVSVVGDGASGWLLYGTTIAGVENLLRYKTDQLYKKQYTAHATFTHTDGTTEPFNFELKRQYPIDSEKQMKEGSLDIGFSQKEVTQNTVDQPVQKSSKDPIEIATGNMYIKAQDIQISNSAIPLQFTRMYNSQEDFDGLLGYGWRTNFDFSLSEDAEGIVYEYNSSGAGTYYTPRYDGSYFTSTGKFSTLTKNPDGTYLITRRHGEKQYFNSEGKLTSVVDISNNTLSINYDINGDLSFVEDQYGRKIEFTVVNGNITELKGPDNRIVSYTYDTNGDLVTITDPIGNTVNYVYDANHNIIEMTNPNGNKTYYAYDAEDRAYSNWQLGDKNKETLSFDSDNQTTLTDANGNSTIYEFNDFGITTKITAADGGVTEFIYNDDMQKSAVINAYGKRTDFTYDSAKNLYQITNSKNQTVTYTYEPVFNKIATITDADNNVTAYTYDASGNLLTVTDALNNVTEYTYDTKGNVLSVKDAKGNVTSFEYDQFSNLIKTTDALLNETIITYDSYGNPLTITDAKGNVTTNTYNDLNQLLSVAYADGNNVSVTYDAFGNKKTTNNQLNQTYTYTYDNAERLVSTLDPLSATVSTTYDLYGNALTLTDQNTNVTSYVYDNKNRVEEESTALNKTTSYTYDLLNRVTSKTDANSNTISYVYDELGNLTETNYPDSTQVTYTYDGLNRKITMTDWIGTTNYTYDKLGRITQLDGPEDNDTIAYTYDAVGNKLTMTDQDAVLTQYTYDELNRLKTVTRASEVTTYTYDELSRVTLVTYPNGATVEKTYDNMSRLVSLVNKDSSAAIISSFTHEYNAAGMITKKTLANGTWIEYDYDSRNRLSRETKKVVIGLAPELILSDSVYEYDVAGNRISLTENLTVKKFWDYHASSFPDQIKQDLTTAGYGPGTSDITMSFKKTYTYNAGNQLNSWSDDIVINSNTFNDSSVAYTYDDNGNRVSKTVTKVGQPLDFITNYTYDFENQLTELEYTNNPDPSGLAIASFSYNANGLRVESVEDSEVTKYLYDGMNSIIERDDTNKTQVSYLRAPGYSGGIGGIISFSKSIYVDDVLDSTTKSYYHYDNLGSVSNTTNESGLAETHNENNKYLFSTKEYEQHAGLYYFGARYYDQETGRWLTPDPMGFIDGLNVYAYCNNNPVNYIDPYGLWTVQIGGSASNINNKDPEEKKARYNRHDGSIGIFINTGHGETKVDFGGFASGGTGGGFNVGTDIFVAVMKGQGAAGVNVNHNLVLGPVRLTLAFGASGKNFQGLAVGLGPAIPIGYSATESHTGDISLREIYDYIFKPKNNSGKECK